MIRTRTISFFLGMACWAISATLADGQQRKPITLDEIYRSNKFTPETLTGLTSTNDGLHYTVQDGRRIKKYSYRSGDLVEVMFDARDFKEIGMIDGYRLSSDEDKILIKTGQERIYRHSYRASYHIYDVKSGQLLKLSDRGKQQLGTLSPDGLNVAFVRDNNLFIRDLDKPEERQITFDGVRNKVINGAPDWVYEEEFGFSQGFHWSPDGKKIALYRFDESRVKEFHMTLFGPLYPYIYKYKYPKAGEENAVVTIHVYDLESGEIRKMDTGPETDQYLPSIKWTGDPSTLCIMRLNRLQNRLDILHANTTTGASEIVYSEENRYYISEVSDHTVTYLSDGERFMLKSEKDGYFHFYIYNYVTGQMHPVTSGSFDVDELVGLDESRKRLYYTSYEASSLERHLYCIGLDGTEKRKLSTRPGTNSAAFSNTFQYYILTHSSANQPRYITLHDRNGDLIRVLLDNKKLVKSMTEYGFARTEFLTVVTKSGQHLNAWMIKPLDFDPKKKYPLFIYVYGGPESQQVIDYWGRRTPWFQMLVQQGYIVACVDNRGTNGRGEAFRKATYMKLGHYETIDQLESAEWFGSLDFIDEERIGIFGWSYGGYMTSLCMTKGNGLYKIGIAVAPVTNWRYYDTIYTERFMRTPGENPEGYDQNSPIHFADQLQGKFLLIHGTGDDNVHYQNSMDFAEALVQANKQFEMQLYPNKNHGIHGGYTSLHLYTRMTDFILENL